jgi:hypothetical protein
MSKNSIGSDEQRLVVSPRRGMRMLDCGRTHFYDLIGKGELDSYLDGRSRKITPSPHKAAAHRDAKSKNSPAPSRARGTAQK